MKEFRENIKDDGERLSIEAKKQREKEAEELKERNELDEQAHQKECGFNQ